MSAPVDITGQQFGELTAIEPTDQRKSVGVVWRCRCSCGAEVYATAKDLRSGNTKSCGHLKREIKDLTGKRFGRLTVQYQTGEKYQGNMIWHCRCDCGNELDVMGRSLTSGNTKSCGCLNREPRPAPEDAVWGSRASSLNKTVPVSNTSGIRGVSWDKRHGDWEAYIKFKGQQFHLGHFDDINDATKARARAEALTFDAFLDFYTENILSERENGGRPPKNIRGQRFGHLIALYPTRKRKNTSVVWRCQCDCGNLVDVKLNHLMTGHTSTCPDCGAKIRTEKHRKYDVPKRQPSASRAKDIKGQRFGFLVAKSLTEKRINGFAVWRCQCDCGKTLLVPYTTLTRKTARPKSCGCVRVRKGITQRQCTWCGTWYEVTPGELGSICPDCDN